MRCTSQPPPKYMDLRTRTAFLWLPKEIGTEGRWLERATWVEMYEVIGNGFDAYWKPVRWGVEHSATESLSR